MVALTEAQKKANDKYIKNNYKQVKLSMPNAEAEALETYCKEKIVQKLDLFDKLSRKKWKENHKYLKISQFWRKNAE